MQQCRQCIVTPSTATRTATPTATTGTSGTVVNLPYNVNAAYSDGTTFASNGGIDAEPQWWLNLQADPRGAVEIAGRRTPVHATKVDEADRQRLWDALMAKCPTYDDYQAGVSRRISLVRLSPIRAQQAA